MNPKYLTAKIPLIVLALSAPLIGHCDEHDYHPFVEEGKTWNYIVHDSNDQNHPGRYPDYERTYKIDGQVEYFGRTYNVMNVYDFSVEPPVFYGPIAYVRDDVENKQTLYRLQPGYNYYIRDWMQRNSVYATKNEVELIDIIDPENTIWESMWNQYTPFEVESPIGTLKGFQSTYSDVAYVESVGVVCPQRDHDGIPFNSSLDLFGEANPCDCIDDDSSYYSYHLMSVVAADGTVIYEVKDNMPTSGVEVVEAEELQFEAIGDVLRVKLPRGAGAIALYDTTGVCHHIASCYGEAVHEIPTSSLQPGIYLLKVDNLTAKVAIK